MEKSAASLDNFNYFFEYYTRIQTVFPPFTHHGDF